MPPDVTRYFITLVIAFAVPCVRHEGGGMLKVSPSSRSSLSLGELTASSPTRIVLIDAGLRALAAQPWLRASSDDPGQPHPSLPVCWLPAVAAPHRLPPSGVPQRRCGAAQRWRSSTMACSVPQGRTSAAAVVAPFRLPLLVQGLQREEQQISGSCCSPGSAAAVGAASQQRQRPRSAPWWRWRLSSRCGGASIRELQGGQ